MMYNTYRWCCILCWCNSFAKGAMYALKSIGPKTDPCGTPVLMLLISDMALFTHTAFVRLCKYDVSHACTSPHNL